MQLKKLPKGAKVFVDASIFVYYLNDDGILKQNWERYVLGRVFSCVFCGQPIAHPQQTSRIGKLLMS